MSSGLLIQLKKNTSFFFVRVYERSLRENFDILNEYYLDENLIQQLMWMSPLNRIETTPEKTQGFESHWRGTFDINEFRETELSLAMNCLVHHMDNDDIELEGVCVYTPEKSWELFMCKSFTLRTISKLNENTEEVLKETLKNMTNLIRSW